MTSGQSKSRAVLFGWLLPVFFLAPEVVNLGFMYLRWDYLLIAAYVLAIMVSGSWGGASLVWSRRTFAIFLLYIAFSIYQLSSLQSEAGILESVKYASWPIKVLIWGAGMCLIYGRLNCSIRHVYLFVRNAALLVFATQILELSFSDFRGLLFDLYPVAAQDRLIELTFRARGPFNGYDLTSIYYLVSGVFVHQYYRHRATSGGERLLVYAICLAGAFISARTGFLLIVTYLMISSYLGFNVLRRAQAFVLVSVVVAGLYFGVVPVPGGADDGIAGRYFELIGAILGGDLGQISSVAGTFYMNEVLLDAGGFESFGRGLTVNTTADQLYFKYLFMFGFTGVVVWIAIHVYIVAQTYSATDTNGALATYRRVVLVVSILIALAHIKGGNYFFASRLGDVLTFLLLLSTASPRSPNLKGARCRHDEAR